MPRYLRYLLIWLSCTAISVTAVVLTVHFVVGSTGPKPPVARSVPTKFPSQEPDGLRTERSPEPSAKPKTKSPSPKPSPSRTPRKTPSPSPSTRPPAADDGDAGEAAREQRGGGSPGCSSGEGDVRTLRSSGGQVSVRFQADGVCLVSAVPTQGFTVRTAQSDPTTLNVTFSADNRRSEITATSSPNRASVRESAWG